MSFASRAELKQVWFVATPPGRSRAGHLVDFSGTIDPTTCPWHEVVDLGDIYRARGERWKHLFVAWLGELNRRNASLGWWAHTTTAKNVLSSPLGNHLFQVLALGELLERRVYENLYVVAATPAQVCFIRAWAARGDSPPVRVRQSLPTRWDASWLAFPRLVFHALRAFFTLFVSAPRPAAPPPFDLAIFTYLDLKVNEDSDAFFGRLHDLLSEQSPGCRVVFTGFVHSPLRATLARLQHFTRVSYWPMFLALQPIDVWWALRRALPEVWTRRYALRTPADPLPGLDLLLRAELRWDLGAGGYLHNLLLYRAARRFARRFAPAALVYPYENKALEKMLILGIREAAPECRLTGYQHTSVTPRHVTLMFVEGEAQITPLPERIITAGEITKEFLARHGNYPPGMLVAGCALRQSPARHASGPLPRRIATRVLLALSSSRVELIRSVHFFRRVAELAPDVQIGIRTHPEFPVRQLPPALAIWVGENCEDFSGTDLATNLAWCDVTAYVSSTVALEALAAGKPVVSFAIGDALDSNPVLGDPPLHWKAGTAAEFCRTLEDIRAVAPDEFQRLAARAAEYVRSYLTPPSGDCIRLFLSPPAPSSDRVGGAGHLAARSS